MSALQRRFAHELAEAPLPREPGNGAILHERDIAELPWAARRYFHFMRAVGRPRDWSFRGSWKGRFRLRPDADWMGCEAWQYNSSVDVARVFHLRVALGHVLPTIGRDTYVNGHGRMHVRLFDRLTVADGRGPEYDMSELVTYLNDAILLAPSMLLGLQTQWWALDDERSFEIELVDRGIAVRARVFLDERGAPLDFVTEDRFCEDPYTRGHPLVRGRWSTPIDDWVVFRNRPFPTVGHAVWDLPGGSFEYGVLSPVPETFVFDVPPAA